MNPKLIAALDALDQQELTKEEFELLLNKMLAKAEPKFVLKEYEGNVLYNNITDKKGLISNIDYEEFVEHSDLDSLCYFISHSEEILKEICETTSFRNKFDSTYSMLPVDIKIEMFVHSLSEEEMVKFLKDEISRYSKEYLQSEFKLINVDEAEDHVDLDTIMYKHGLCYQDSLDRCWAKDAFDLIDSYDAINYVSEGEAKEKFGLYSKDEVLITNPFTDRILPDLDD